MRQKKITDIGSDILTDYFQRPEAFTHRVSAEIIERARAMSPTDKIRWLARAKRFIFKNVSPEKLARWQELRSKQNGII